MNVRAAIRTLGGASILLVYRGLAGGLPILLALYIGSHWGLADLAAFTIAHAAVSVGLVLVDWGTTRALPRDLAVSDPEKSRNLVASANGMRAVFAAALAAVMALAVVAKLTPEDVLPHLTVLFLLIPISIVSTNAVGERTVSGQMRGLGVAIIAGLIVFVSLATWAVASGCEVYVFTTAYVLGKATEAVLATRGRVWVLRVSFVQAWKTAMRFGPFGLQAVLAVTYSRAAVFTVGKLLSRPELGVLSLATALQNCLLLIPTSLALIAFPQLTRLASAGDRNGIRNLLVRYALMSVAATAAGLLAVWAGTVWFHERLSVPVASVPLVVSFAAIAILSIFSTMCGFLMQAIGAEAMAARLSLVTLGLALVYQVAGVKLFGLWGIVGAVALAELSTVVVFGGVLLRARQAS